MKELAVLLWVKFIPAYKFGCVSWSGMCARFLMPSPDMHTRVLERTLMRDRCARYRDLFLVAHQKSLRRKMKATPIFFWQILTAESIL